MPRKSKKSTAKKKKKTEYVRVIHKGKRLLFTKKEFNGAYLRAKKRSGLN